MAGTEDASWSCRNKQATAAEGAVSAVAARAVEAPALELAEPVAPVRGAHTRLLRSHSARLCRWASSRGANASAAAEEEEEEWLARAAEAREEGDGECLPKYEGLNVARGDDAVVAAVDDDRDGVAVAAAEAC